MLLLILLAVIAYGLLGVLSQTLGLMPAIIIGILWAIIFIVFRIERKKEMHFKHSIKVLDDLKKGR
jgi:MFS superfamily sulfate permease-like transporter